MVLDLKVPIKKQLPQLSFKMQLVISNKRRFNLIHLISLISSYVDIRRHGYRLEFSSKK